MAIFLKMKSSGTVRISIKIATAYFTAGALWILLSDKMVGAIVHDPAVITEVSMIKGWGFVSITAFMLYVLIGRWTSRLESVRRKRRA